MRFSIVVVCLNAGEKLGRTVDSILKQSFNDYEIVIKDGLSSDGSLETLRQVQGEDTRLRIYEEKDTGIYDAMNQAIPHCRGDYLLFLNCGDYLAAEDVLARMAEGIDRTLAGKESREPYIFYGDIYERLGRTAVASNPHMDAFACYRNVPCHQCCFYDRGLFSGRGYDTGYRVRADYEHFLWSCFVRGAVPVWLPVVVASYEGGGFSETAQNRKVSATEHKAITKRYFSRKQLFTYRLILLLTLAPLRTKMAQSPALSGVYNRIKKLLYR